MRKIEGQTNDEWSKWNLFPGLGLLRLIPMGFKRARLNALPYEKTNPQPPTTNSPDSIEFLTHVLGYKEKDVLELLFTDAYTFMRGRLEEKRYNDILEFFQGKLENKWQITNAACEMLDKMPQPIATDLEEWERQWRIIK
ncbi:MAG: hypothetical protein A3J14_03265 [Candidatus Levybacteria bacterium RIFCSPLOWO2_02_FULL_37_18]|nr:MAG: hypothetical protein A3J14_03265 [Candidatus Levybacteria bacterium RIFCSPLOWO2_02_FULL_37_18]